MTEEMDDWRNIPPERVEFSSSTLSFFDPAGWRFHIPAFMTWTLSNWRTSNSITTYQTICSLSDYRFLLSQNRIAQLDSAQIFAIVAFLAFIADHEPPDYEGQPHEALKGFWMPRITDGNLESQI